MGIFAMGAGHVPNAGPEAGVELSDEQRGALPTRFEAVGEALASGAGAVDACAVTGRELALDGVSLDEALGGLEATSRLVTGALPGFADSRALAVGWSEATLGYLHRLSCEDPVTGLASLAHLQSRISELYRGQLRDRLGARDGHALVVIDPAPTAVMSPRVPAEVLAADLRAARFAEAARTVFAGSETIGRLGRHRIVVVTGRDERLGRRVGLVKDMLSAVEGGVRVWIEGLPGTEAAAATLLAELARA